MAALKAHPFFESIDWNTLWTIPAPLLEPGLVKRERNPPGAVLAESNWDDNWEDMIGMPRGEDGIPWAGEDEDEDEYDDKEEERTEHGLDSRISNPQQHNDEEHVDGDEKADVPPDGGESPVVNGRSSSQPVNVPTQPQQEVIGTGSATSSSEGSPIEKLAAAFDAALNRGRNRLQTPIQGNGDPSPDWYNIYVFCYARGFKLFYFTGPRSCYPENRLYTTRQLQRQL
jgi:3-phosphoinositide dependent protein kinase-1